MVFVWGACVGAFTSVFFNVKNRVKAEAFEFSNYRLQIVYFSPFI